MSFVLSKYTNATYELGAYVAAALLNAQMPGWTPVLSSATVQSMWNAWVAGLPYHPAPGIDWGATDIITYLKTTMT
jgi:hypothetical protein